MGKNKKIFKIAWDCDGVLAESHKSVLKAANEKLSQILGKKICLTKSDLNVYDALYKKALILTHNEKQALEINMFWHTPEILRLSPPNLAALEVFKRCQKLPDTTQCVITTRRFQNRRITQEWLEQYLPSINWQKNLYIRQESDTLTGEEFKLFHLGRINCIVEDNSITVPSIHIKLPQCYVIYLNQPWNVNDHNTHQAQFRVDFDDPETIYQRILEIRENYLSI